MPRVLLVPAAVLLALAPLPSRAEEASLPPLHRVSYSSLLAARVNPLGLEEQLAVGYQRRLHSDPGQLWRGCFVGVDLTPVLNPALAKLGAQVTVRPIAVLMLSARYSFMGFLKTFGYLQSYTSPHQDHSETALDAAEERNENYATIGGELQLQAEVLGKVGPVVLRNDLKLFHSTVRLRTGDKLFYSFTIDAMVPDGGWSLTNDTDLIYLTRFGLVAGLRNTVVHTIYRDGDFAAGERLDNPNTPHVRIGPLLAYVFYDRPGRWFNKPTLLVIVNWYLRHRFRTGVDVNRGVPYVVIGFKFSGDLWQRD